LLPKEDATNKSLGSGSGGETVEVDREGEVMKSKRVADNEHGPRHVTPAGRSVFYDLFPPEKAAEMEMRAQLLMGLEQWLERNRMTQSEAAKVLGVTQARVSDLKRGKINRFSMDLLVRLAARAGLKPKLKLAA
jgi:predicted XRE-type DNA-binding protein